MQSIYYIQSDKTQQCSKYEDKVNIILQYFIHKNRSRFSEIRNCLRKNVLNKKINKIYLLNERIYKRKELGIESDKIVQINIKKRLTFEKVFDLIESEKIKGYIIVCNSDMFFDQTLSNLFISGLYQNKKVFCQLRFEFKNEKDLQKCKLFGPRYDSQDVWIFHSKHNVPKNLRKNFKFCFGKPGCDNKLTYLWKIFGYDITNDPYFIRTYHYHSSQIRDYSNKDIISYPFIYLLPTCEETIVNEYYLKIKELTNDFSTHGWDEVNILKTYIQKNEIFHISEKPLIENQLWIDSFLNQSRFHNRCSKIVFEIYHYIKNGNVWTYNLKGRSILILSKYKDIIKEKINDRKEIYGVDLFPECTFVFSEEDKFDVVLSDDTSYNNTEKSIIHLGDFLNIYFGIVNKTFVENRKDIFRNFLNKHWTVIKSNFSENINIEHILKKEKLFWQYPVITEQTFYEQEKENPNFLGFPWATVIDKKININEIYKLLSPRIKREEEYYTCCQHIYFRYLQNLWKLLNITCVYTPHKCIGEDYLGNIKLIACPLYAVNLEDKRRNKMFLENLKPERGIFYSFVGAFGSKYMSDVRVHLTRLKNPPNCFVHLTQNWHFEELVYNNKNQNHHKLMQESKAHVENTQKYNYLLLVSRFMLAPSGTGPSSIRFWEALGAGAIPVLLSDKLELPAHPLWDDAIVRIKELQYKTIPEVLGLISNDRETELRNNCLKIYKHFANNYANR